ncbi:hypothetical protein [Streptomyces sp. GZWMJZ-114]|uniref:hypothetical protein n=1 Tax=Streptomyces sp. GZWMJZ-114 TaxID=2494734 RepID=UPI001011FADD|nr:hypothetical protein [Streptomyces sp. GZWMJZ-114]
MKHEDPGPITSARRVIVGVSGSGASAVVTDERIIPCTRLSNGILLQEVWQQRELPAVPEDRPDPDWALGPAAPAEGAVIRMLTVPAASGSRPAEPHLHTDPSLHVITMLSGELVLLEDGEVTLGVGDSVVLRDSMHDLRNLKARPATFVYTSFPLVHERVHER